MSAYPIFPGSTIVCIGSGPSLTTEDCAFVRGKARVIAINRSMALAPWADVAYCADARMWKWLHDDGTLATVTGARIGLEQKTGDVRDVADYGVHVLRCVRQDGLGADPTALHSGEHSGYQAINLAVHMGAVRIVLLGYDGRAEGKQADWHAPHPSPSKPHAYGRWSTRLRTLAAPLAARGIEIINCSRQTAYDCFPVRPLRDVLRESAVAA